MLEIKQIFEEALQQHSKGLYHKALASFKEVAGRDEEPDRIYYSLARGFILECYKLLGVKYISQELYKNAMDTIDEALAEFPGNPHIMFQRGIALNNAQNFPASVRVFESIFSTDPNFPAIRLCLGIALINLGNLDRTDTILRDALSLPPHDATFYHLLAIAHFRRHQYQEVESLILRALELKQPYPEAQINLIGAYIVLKQNEDAYRHLLSILPFVKNRAILLPPLIYLTRRLQISPDDPAVIDFLREQPAAGNVTEAEIRRWAEERFYQTLLIDVLSLPFQDSEGELNRHAWFRGLLIKQYQRMIQDGMDLPELYFQLGRELQRVKKYSEALDYFRKCLAAKPSFLPAKISMAFTVKEMGDHADALARFEDIYQSFKSTPDMVLYSGESNLEEAIDPLKADHLKAELKILVMALSQNPDFADLHYNIGRIHYLLDDPEQALNYFSKACLLNPNFIRANIGKAIALMQLNQTEQSREVLTNLSQNNNLCAKITYNLAILHYQQGNHARARALLQELIPLNNEFSGIARETLAKIPVNQ